MTIKQAEYNDLAGLLQLYTYLHDNEIPIPSESLEKLWEEILSDHNHIILIGVENGQIACSCVLVIILNLTHQQRPYALIENVITHPDFRNKRYATKLLHHAKKIAVARNCYKIMLLTGAKEESTLRFYRNAGYNSEDKTAFIQWL